MIKEHVSRKVSTLEALVITASGALAGSIAGAPRVILSVAGRSGFIALILLGIVGVLWTMWMTSLARGLPHRSIPVAIGRLSQWIARPWLVFVAGFEVLYCATALREFSIVVATIFIPMSPVPVIMALIAGCAFTAARHRLEALSRVVMVFFFLFMVPAVVSLGLLIARADDQWALLPGGPVVLSSLMHAELVTFFLIAGLSIVPLLLPYAATLAPEKGIAGPILGAAFTGFVVLLSYSAAVTTGGPGYVLTQLWPVISALRTLVFRDFFINRFGLLVLFAWSGLILSFVAIRLWAFSEAMCLATGLTSRRAIAAGVGAVLAILIGLIPDSVLSVQQMVVTLVSPGGILIAAGWICVGLLAAWHVRHTAGTVRG